VEVLLERYTITELSEKLKVTDHALRYYEKEFKITVPKDERGRRYYTKDLANIMYQIKSMRDDGLEIKAIKKILESENVICDSNSIPLDDKTLSIVPISSKESYPDIKQFFNEFKSEITCSITKEVASAKEHFTREINRSKLEIGACVENSSRKLEAKMDKHFQDVDLSLGKWREKNKKGFLRRILGN
jgi:DNA-binding transcriptional MerR regulator